MKFGTVERAMGEASRTTVRMKGLRMAFTYAAALLLLGLLIVVLVSPARSGAAPEAVPAKVAAHGGAL